MTYASPALATDTAGGYTYIHCKQRYDAITAVLAAQGNWTLVDTVDQVSGANTNRRYVWKCASPGNGLTTDFYLVFECTFITATGAWTQGATSSASPWCSMGEAYNSTTKVLSKMVTVLTSATITMAADMTNPATWTLTAARPTATGAIPLYVTAHGVGSATTERLYILATASVLIVVGNGGPMYAGVFDSILNSTDDPMPLFLGGDGTGNTASNQSGGSTRHPKQTPGAVAYWGGLSGSTVHTTSTAGNVLGGPAGSTSAYGAIGDVANTLWSLYQGGVPTYRFCIASVGSNTSPNTASQRGGLRGYYRNLLSGNTITHSIGDTFTVDGKTYVAITTGSNLMDTTA